MAVITCTWQPATQQSDAALPHVPELVAATAQACLQAWAQRVPGSFCGRTAQGVGLLLVPAYALAHETAQALGALLNSSARSAGALDGAWAVRVIGPLECCDADDVGRQLVQAGWPLS